MKRALLITRDESLKELVQSSIPENYQLLMANSEDEAKGAMKKHKASVLMIEQYLGSEDGLDVLGSLTAGFGVFEEVVLLTPEKTADTVIKRAKRQFVNKILKRPITSGAIIELLKGSGESESADNANPVEWIAESFNDPSGKLLRMTGLDMEAAFLLRGDALSGVLHPNYNLVYKRTLKSAGVDVEIGGEDFKDLEAMGRLETKLSSVDGFADIKKNVLLSMLSSLPLCTPCRCISESKEIPSGLIEISGVSFLSALVETLPLEFLENIDRNGNKLKTSDEALSTQLNLTPLHGWVLSQCASPVWVDVLLKTAIFPRKELLPQLYFLLLCGLLTCVSCESKPFRMQCLLDHFTRDAHRIDRESKAIESLVGYVLERGQSPYTILGVAHDSDQREIIKACETRQSFLDRNALHPEVYEKYNKDIMLLKARYSEALLLLQSAKIEDILQQSEEEAQRVSRGPTRLGGNLTRKQEASVRRKKTAEDMYIRARDLFDEENFHEASQMLRLSLVQDPYNADAHHLMAKIYQKSPNARALHMAEKEFLRAAELDPWKVKIMVDLAEFYAQNNQGSRSKTFLKKAKSIEKRNAKMESIEKGMGPEDLDESQ